MNDEFDLPILLDCDGVLADFSTACLSLQSYGTLTAKDVHQWDIFGLMDERDRRFIFNAIEDPQFWREMPLMEGALAGYEALRKSGNRIVICTSPWMVDIEGKKEVMPGWIDARIDWLRKHFDIHSAAVLPLGDKYLVEGRLLIDDRPKNVELYQKRWGAGAALLFDAPYNKNVDLPRATWEEIIEFC